MSNEDNESKKTKRPYEPPRIFDLSGSVAHAGAKCRPGNQVGEGGSPSGGGKKCQPGGIASGGKCQPGNLAGGGNCNPGSSASAKCQPGGNPSPVLRRPRGPPATAQRAPGTRSGTLPPSTTLGTDPIRRSSSLATRNASPWAPAQPVCLSIAPVGPRVMPKLPATAQLSGF